MLNWLLSSQWIIAPIFGKLDRQRPEIAQAVLPQHADLVDHGAGLLGLGVGGGEEAVPEESHLLFERTFSLIMRYTQPYWAEVELPPFLDVHVVAMDQEFVERWLRLEDAAAPRPIASYPRATAWSSSSRVAPNPARR